VEPKKLLKNVVFVLVVGNLALLAYVLLGMASPKPTPMPNPNGYDDFVKAAALLKGNPVDYREMKREELGDLVAANAGALKLLQTGISKQCRASADYSRSNFNNELLPRLSSLKQFVFLFCAKGRLAESEGRTNDAVQFYVDGIRYGQDVGQGGVLIEKLVSIACQAVAARPLENLRTNLDAKQCTSIAHELESTDAQEETDELVQRHESEFSRIYGGIKGQLVKLFMFKSIEASRKKFFIKLHASQLNRRQMMLTFAARAYELDKGKPPSNAAALVPEYLKKIPQDPATGTNLVCHP
jgi:hypothetical protein